jgi:hypothetical protein
MKQPDVKLLKNNKLTKEDIIKISDAFKQVIDGLDIIMNTTPYNFSTKTTDYILSVKKSLDLLGLQIDDELYETYNKIDLIKDIPDVIRNNNYKGSVEE